MVNSKQMMFAVFMLCLCMLGAPLQAQYSQGEAGVVGTGSVSIDRQPNLLRLQLLMSAEGKDIKEAVAKLKEKEAAAKEKLQKLGATEASVSFSDPQPQDANQRNQMERMIQLRTGRQAKPGKPAAPSITLSTTLKAEWPLAAKDGDGLLVESQELQGKIKGADLAGAKGDKALTPEQQEEAEEAAGQGNMNDGQPNPNDPAFIYVCKIAEEDIDKARADAFKKAKDDAARLAKAAGIELGAIHILAGTAGPNYGGDPSNPYEYAMQQRAMYGMVARQESDDSTEAISNQAGKVSYRVSVNVAFSVK